MRHCIIVVGGHINDIFAKEFIEKERPELCIAADSGMNFFYRNKLTPDWIIGDFDSASNEAFDYFSGKSDISWIRLNPVKDDTDTESAIRKSNCAWSRENYAAGSNRNKNRPFAWKY